MHVRLMNHSLVSSRLQMIGQGIPHFVCRSRRVWHNIGAFYLCKQSDACNCVDVEEILTLILSCPCASTTQRITISKDLHPQNYGYEFMSEDRSIGVLAHQVCTVMLTKHMS